MIEYNVFPDMKIRCMEVSSKEELEQMRKEGRTDHVTWYATKAEIEAYKDAQDRVEVSGDEKCFHNPTDIDVWVKRNGNEWFCVPAGGKIDFNNVE